MTGTTNQVQTPFGSGVQASLGLSSGSAGGIAEIPANPGISYTGTLYGSLFSVWQAASTAANGYTTPLVVANYDNAGANNSGNALPLITALNMGGIQQINNGVSGTLLTVTSLVGNSLIQFSSDFSMTVANLTTLTLPVLQYIGGNFGLSAASLTTVSFPDLVAVNGLFGMLTANATTVSFPNLVYVGGSFGPTFSGSVATNFNSLQYVGTNFSISGGAMTSFSLPALVSIGTTFQITDASLVTFSMGSTLKSIGGNFTMTGMALNQASVDGILVRLAALDGTSGTTAYSSHTVNLSGGTSSTPSSTGLAAKAVLVGRSCVVTTN